MSRIGIRVAMIFLGIASPGVFVASGDSSFKLSHRILLGGEGGWDALAVDSSTHRLFVTHGTRVQVVDTRTDKVLGEIPDTPGVHGVALAPDLGRGFTSNGRDSSVTMFDLNSLAVLGKLKLNARNPDAIEYDPVSKRVFAFNGGSASATAIEAAADTVIGSVPLGGKPEFAAADGEGTLTVIHEDGPDKYSVVETVPTQKGCRTLALDEATGSVYEPTADFGPPPAPTADHPHPRPSVVPGTFVVLVSKR